MRRASCWLAFSFTPWALNRQCFTQSVCRTVQLQALLGRLGLALGVLQRAHRGLEFRSQLTAGHILVREHFLAHLLILLEVAVHVVAAGRAEE